LHHSGDVVVVYMTNHGEIDTQPVGGPTQGVKSRLQAIEVDTRRPTID
jgi:hypothetical protein